MGEAAKTAKRYREHAEQLRIIAGEDRDPVIAETLLRVARDYELTADNLEAIELTEQRLMRHRHGSLGPMAKP
jgi:hypothetical protein